ncbi:Cuticle protein 8 [Orchesella cincta]|uniref:Cuticle protein 8 n=1 Tax=Orchesella cincta TaxID=48709 RepID=A0A1D2N1P7_ORCCI|nr:Cuticle protein 8 [Orchesella cincta]
MKAFVAILAVVVVAVSAQGGLGGGQGGGLGGEGGGHGWGWAYPAYKYSYGVTDKHTGDQKSASEVRDGGVTKGSYSLVQPDGVLRTVSYIVTPHGGFQAQVHNKGVAGHPAHYHHGHGIGGGRGGLGGGIGGGILG